MKGDNLSTKEVVSSSQCGGDLDVDLAAACIQVLDTPVVVVSGALVRCRPAILVHYQLSVMFAVHRDEVPVTLEPSSTPISLAAVVHFAHVHHDRTIVCTADSFVLAAPVTVLLVHLDGHSVARCDCAFTCYALGAAGIATYVIR